MAAPNLNLTGGTATGGTAGAPVSVSTGLQFKPWVMISLAALGVVALLVWMKGKGR